MFPCENWNHRSTVHDCATLCCHDWSCESFEFMEGATPSPPGPAPPPTRMCCSSCCFEYVHKRPFGARALKKKKKVLAGVQLVSPTDCNCGTCFVMRQTYTVIHPRTDVNMTHGCVPAASPLYTHPCLLTLCNGACMDALLPLQFVIERIAQRRLDQPRLAAG